MVVCYIQMTANGLITNTNDFLGSIEKVDMHVGMTMLKPSDLHELFSHGRYTNQTN